MVLPAMDFGALPPEVNSLRMYSGPGSAPMLAAMAAWDDVSAEMLLTAAAYESVLSALLSDGWLGPATAAMAAAAALYVTWLSATGLQAAQTAGQAAAAAAAFEAAFAMTVPPSVVAANRVQLLTLVATNFLGINTPAIAATEAEYAEMWAQDATAMYGYGRRFRGGIHVGTIFGTSTHRQPLRAGGSDRGGCPGGEYRYGRPHADRTAPTHVRGTGKSARTRRTGGGTA